MHNCATVHVLGFKYTDNVQDEMQFLNPSVTQFQASLTVNCAQGLLRQQQIHPMTYKACHDQYTGKNYITLQIKNKS